MWKNGVANATFVGPQRGLGFPEGHVTRLPRLTSTEATYRRVWKTYIGLIGYQEIFVQKALLHCSSVASIGFPGRTSVTRLAPLQDVSLDFFEEEALWYLMRNLHYSELSSCRAIVQLF